MKSYKTAKYTLERPLHIGAALAGVLSRLVDALSGYAVPLSGAHLRIANSQVAGLV